MSRKIAQLLDVPYDAAGDACRVTVVDGRSARAENCGALVEYSGECIRFSGGAAIHGTELEIRMMRRDEVLIYGLIAAVTWE